MKEGKKTCDGELIQQYNSDCVLALGCKNLQWLCQNPTLWKHVNSAAFATGITKSEFYPQCGSQ